MTLLGRLLGYCVNALAILVFGLLKLSVPILVLLADFSGFLEFLISCLAFLRFLKRFPDGHFNFFAVDFARYGLRVQVKFCVNFFALIIVSFILSLAFPVIGFNGLIFDFLCFGCLCFCYCFGGRVCCLACRLWRGVSLAYPLVYYLVDRQAFGFRLRSTFFHIFSLIS